MLRMVIAAMVGILRSPYCCGWSAVSNSAKLVVGFRLVLSRMSLGESAMNNNEVLS
jgi:hypothetical protein